MSLSKDGKQLRPRRDGRPMTDQEIWTDYEDLRRAVRDIGAKSPDVSGIKIPQPDHKPGDPMSAEDIEKCLQKITPQIQVTAECADSSTLKTEIPAEDFTPVREALQLVQKTAQHAVDLIEGIRKQRFELRWPRIAAVFYFICTSFLLFSLSLYFAAILVVARFGLPKLIAWLSAS